jgi:hypothetical protein
MNEAVEQALMNAHKTKLREYRMKDAKALHLIQNDLDDTIFPNISLVRFCKTSFDILESAYQGATKVKTLKLQTLGRYFETLEMKESKSIDHYFNHVTTNVNQLKMYGEDVLD